MWKPETALLGPCSDLHSAVTVEYKSPEALMLSTQILGLSGQNEQTQNKGGRNSHIYPSALSPQDRRLSAELLSLFFWANVLFHLSFATFSKDLDNCHFNIFITLTFNSCPSFPLLGSVILIFSLCWFLRPSSSSHLPRRFGESHPYLVAFSYSFVFLLFHPGLH